MTARTPAQLLWPVPQLLVHTIDTTVLTAAAVFGRERRLAAVMAAGPTPEQMQAADVPIVVRTSDGRPVGLTVSARASRRLRIARAVAAVHPDLADDLREVHRLADCPGTTVPGVCWCTPEPTPPVATDYRRPAPAGRPTRRRPADRPWTGKVIGATASVVGPDGVAVPPYQPTEPERPPLRVVPAPRGRTTR